MSTSPDLLNLQTQSTQVVYPGEHELWHYDFFKAVAIDRDLTYFPDAKTLLDGTAKIELGKIALNYELAASQPEFNPNTFFLDHFELPKYLTPDRDHGLSVDQYITKGWVDLSYYEPHDKGTLIGLPNPSLCPGDRFCNETYYDDTLEGVRGILAEARLDAKRGDRSAQQQKETLVLGIIENFLYQIDRFGYPLNATRSYYVGRSQLPVFMEMVLVAEAHFGDRLPHLREDCLPGLTKEYEWGMSGPRLADLIGPDGKVYQLNRNWDDEDTPRPEAFAEDIKTASLADDDPHVIYRHIRAAAGSMRDFTARYMSDPNRLETIHTTDFVSPEPNSLWYLYELELAKAHKRAGRTVLQKEFEDRARQRREAMNIFLWKEDKYVGGYYDYDFVHGQRSEIRSMGMAYPVAVGASSAHQKIMVANNLRTHMLKDGGFISTDVKSSQQWDRDNGWAIDQIKGIQAFIAAGDKKHAFWAAYRWLQLDRIIFKEVHAMAEKSNVVERTIGSGGEYKPQFGFLWSNGVHRALKAFLAGELVLTI